MRDGTAFKAIFAGKKTTEVTSRSTGTGSAEAVLAREIKAQLDRGTSLNDVITQLAGSLATSVAAQLGIPADTAKQQLTQAFTQALQPSGAGPPGSNAERASTLATRFRQIAELATRVTNGDPGQPIRTIAGTSLDADSAKANPAPQTDRILRDALTALAAPASPAATSTPTTTTDPGTTGASVASATKAPTVTDRTVVPSAATPSAPTKQSPPSTAASATAPAMADAATNLATLLAELTSASASPAAPVAAAPVPVAPAAASDGRAVALPATLEAIATGGDTPLGRILTRATLADTARTAPAADPISTGATKRTTTDGTPPPARTQNPLPASGANGSTTGTTTASTGTSATATVTAFVQAFAAELARSDGSQSRDATSTTTVADAGAQSPATAPAATQPQVQPVPFALTVAHDASTVVPTPPAPALPQPQHVDANAVVDQILRGMAIRTTDGQSVVRLRLVPEQLGDVSVKLVVSGGSVDASITAHTADAQNALAGGQNQLAKTLADAGLKLQSFTVGLAGGGFADARDQSRPNEGWTRSNTRRIAGVSSTEPDASDDASLLAVPTFGPPIYAANPTLGALNYLV